jgi:hypothetical protein
MNIKHILLAMTLIPVVGFSQLISGDQKIDDSNVIPWTPKQISDFQGEYHFGFSEGGIIFSLVLL